jgi:hypothetical protein
VIDETEVARFKKAYAGSDGVAFMVILTAELGKKVKAPIFVRDGFFSYPNEKSARELIMFHEFRHAQDMHDGIDFGGGLRIDSSNHLMFQPETIGCIWELRGNEGVCVGTLEQQRPGNYTWSFNNAAREIAANYKKLVATMPKTDVEAKVVEAVKAQYRGLTGEQ